MSAPREGPNPLRPYYVPPSVGPALDVHNTTSTSTYTGSKHASTGHATNSFGSSARNILADMDYSEYIPAASPSSSEIGKQLVEQAIWKYTSVFLAQPFEVAKTVLQVQLAPGGDQRPSAQARVAEKVRRQPGRYRDPEDIYDTSDESDTDSQSYFTSQAPQSHTPSRPSRARQRQDSFDSPYEPHATPPPIISRSSTHSLELRSASSLIATLSALWTKEGAWGVWKGTNSTYVYTLALSTLTSFTRSFLSAILALPDPGLSFHLSTPLSYAGGLDVLSSSSPLTSLAVAVSAAGIASVILAPLDIARTKVMLTPSTHPPRSIIATLKSLPSWALPFSIAPVTFIHATISTLISASTPLFLRSRLGVDPLLTPTLYSIGTSVGQAVELMVKLPVETVLRRGQLHVAQVTANGRDVQTVVNVGPYKGIIGTMYSIVNEEGERSSRTNLAKVSEGRPAALKAGASGAENRRKKGNGLEGLWRGWRVGMWGLIGVWGAAAVGGVGSKGGEF